MTITTSPTPEACVYPPGGGALQRDDWLAMLNQMAQAAFFGLARITGRSGNTTLALDDAGVINRCTAALTLTLPAGATLSNGWGIAVLATGGTVTLAVQGADTIEATTIQTGQAANVWFDGSVFRVRIEGAAPIPALAGQGGKLLRVKSDASGLEYVAQDEELIVVDQKAQGTAAGGFTAGDWRQRVLNTSLRNTITGASLAANRVTLPAGTYRARASAPAFAAQQHVTRLYDITGDAELLRGTSAYSVGSQTDSQIDGVFTLTEASLVELQHRCAATAGSNGLGVATNLDGVETYARAAFTRLP